MEKLIGNSRYINSKLDNIYTNITLSKTASLYKEEELVKDISEYSTYVAEREKSTKYLVYGKTEFLFDPFNEYSSKDWVFEIGYPTYQYDNKSKIRFNFVDIGLIMIYDNMDINIDETLIFNKDNKYVYAKVISIDNKEDGLYLTIDSLKDLNGYTLYIKEIKYTKVFNSIAELTLYNNGYAVNIFNNQIYQYANVDDIDISKYKGFLNEPLNEFVYRLKYIGSTQKSFKLSDENIISRNIFNIDEITHTELEINYMWLYFNIRNNVREQENPNTNINESGRVRDSSDRSTTTRSTGNQTNDNPRSSAGNVRISGLPDRIEGKGMLSIEQTLPMFIYNYIIRDIKQYGDIVAGHNYSDTKLPDNVILYEDNSYRYRELISFENSDIEIPFMNNKHYIYEDLKFILSRVKPISKYNPLYYIDEIDEEGISSLVNPLERRLC